MKRQIDKPLLMEAFGQEKPKYHTLTFPDNRAFEKWFKGLAKYKITLADDGQDFLVWWIDERGEVLHSDGQSAVWDGTMVDVSFLEIGSLLRMKTRFDNEVQHLIHVIENVEEFAL